MIDKFYKLPYWTYSVLFGLLMFSAWSPSPIPVGAFVGFSVLFFMEYRITAEQEKKVGAKVFRYTYLGFLIWNVLTTWWVWNASPGGTVVAILANSLLMTLPFFFYHKTRVWVGDRISFVSFLFYWVGFEYLHLNWDISWPWITIGNVFSNSTYLIQWYEYTGILGGTVWVLLVNYVLFQSLLIKWLKVVSFAALVIIPIGFSLLIDAPENTDSIEIVVVQPNINPFTEKFPGSEHYIPYEEQFDRLIKLSEEKLTDSTRFLLWPETALQGSHFEQNLQYDPVINKCKQFMKKYPNLTLITGMESWNRLSDTINLAPTVKYREGLGYYETYNTAILINSKGYKLYHKSRLVPGVETLPFPMVLGFVQDIININGAGNYGTQEERTVFYDMDSTGIAPLICYESIYGEFVGEYINNGAHIIGIITNDGWWGDTPGYRQHYEYAKLRAIEHRKPVARAANTGVSGFINSSGKEIQQLGYDKIGVLKATLHYQKEKTFFATYGNYIGRTAAFFSIILLLSALIKHKKNGWT